MKKRRLLRLLGLGLALLAFVGYFAFSTFLFSPFEGDYELDVATLVPRDVDLFTAKAQLSEDLDGDLSLRVAVDLEELREGRALMNLEEVEARLVAFRDVQAELEAALAGLPVEVDLVDVALGRELAIAAYLEPGERKTWGTWLRVNWMGKLGYSLLPYLDLSAEGMEVTEEDGIFTLTGGQLTEPLHLLRIRDVLVAGTSRELVAGALELEASRGEDSMHQSARYHDHIQGREGRDAEDLELFVDIKEVLAHLGTSGAWPAADGEGTWGKLVSEFFQLSSVTEATGVVGFRGGPELQLTVDISTEGLSGEEKRLYRIRGYDKSPRDDEGAGSTRSDTLRDVAGLVPHDAYLAVIGKADVADVLRAGRSGLEEGDRNLVDDTVRQVWGYADALPLIDEIAFAVEDRFALIVVDNDYVEPVPETAPEHDGQPVFAWSLVFWIQDPDKIDELRQKIINNQAAFGIAGRNPGQGGVFWNRETGGYKVYEYHHPFIAGTGHLSSVTDDQLFIVSNSHLMLGELLQTKRSRGSSGYPSLMQHPNFGSLLGQGLDNANLLLWWNPRVASEKAREIARNLAYQSIFVNWDVERPRLYSKIAKEHWPEHLAAVERDQVPPEIEEEFDALYQQEATAFEQDFVSQHGSAEYLKREQRILASELLKGLLVEVEFDPKRWQVYTKALVDLDE